MPLNFYSLEKNKINIIYLFIILKKGLKKDRV